MLSELFSVILSFAAKTNLDRIEQMQIWRALVGPWGRELADIQISVRDGVARRQLTVSRGAFSEVLEEEMRSREFVSMYLSVVLPFYSGEIRFDYNRSEIGDSLGILFGQGQFLASPQGPYIKERIEDLGRFGERIFGSGPFIVGCLAVEEGVVGVEGLEENPPVDWVFWEEDVMRRVEGIELFATCALDVREVARGGLFWKWADFGEQPDTKSRKMMRALQEQLSKALVELRRCRTPSSAGTRS